MADIDDWNDEPQKAVDIGMAEDLPELPEIKLFGKWSCDEVNVSDMSLQVRSSTIENKLHFIVTWGVLPEACQFQFTYLYMDWAEALGY